MMYVHKGAKMLPQKYKYLVFLYSVMILQVVWYVGFIIWFSMTYGGSIGSMLSDMCHNIDFFLLRFGSTLMILIFFIIGRRISTFVNQLQRTTTYERKVSNDSELAVRKMWLTIYLFTFISTFLMAFDLLSALMDFECNSMTQIDWLDSTLWFANRLVNLNIWVWVVVYLSFDLRKPKKPMRKRKGSFLAGSDSPLVVGHLLREDMNPS
jgi:hypothetical protein